MSNALECTMRGIVWMALLCMLSMSSRMTGDRELVIQFLPLFLAAAAALQLPLLVRIECSVTWSFHRLLTAC